MTPALAVALGTPVDKKYNSPRKGFTEGRKKKWRAETKGKVIGGEKVNGKERQPR